MKVRLHKNSVRVRLSRSEVALLAEGTRVEQTTTFSKISHVVSSVECTKEVSAVEATFNGQHLALRIPADRVLQWAQSDQVSINSSQQIDETRSLDILIEKDFKCLHGNSTENEDTFPNPLA